MHGDRAPPPAQHDTLCPHSHSSVLLLFFLAVMAPCLDVRCPSLEYRGAIANQNLLSSMLTREEEGEAEKRKWRQKRAKARVRLRFSPRLRNIRRNLICERIVVAAAIGRCRPRSSAVVRRRSRLPLVPNA